MKKAEIIFTHFRELCQFKRSSETKDCRVDFERKVLTGTFPETEINMAVLVFGATIKEPMTV